MYDLSGLSTTVVPRPLSNDPRLFQCIHCYSHASKRFVEVYTTVAWRTAAVYQYILSLFTNVPSSIQIILALRQQ